jgi:hypothetical protein
LLVASSIVSVAAVTECDAVTASSKAVDRMLLNAPTFITYLPQRSGLLPVLTGSGYGCAGIEAQYEGNMAVSKRSIVE